MNSLYKEFADPQYYLFRDAPDNYPMKFNVYFKHNCLMYRYIMHILKDEILKEELTYRNALAWFSYIEILSTDITSIPEENTEERRLFLKLLNNMC